MGVDRGQVGLGRLCAHLFVPMKYVDFLCVHASTPLVGKFVNLTLSRPREDALGKEVDSWQGEVMNQCRTKCPELVSVMPDPQTKVEEALGTCPSLPEGLST